MEVLEILLVAIHLPKRDFHLCMSRALVALGTGILGYTWMDGQFADLGSVYENLDQLLDPCRSLEHRVSLKKFCLSSASADLHELDETHLCQSSPLRRSRRPRSSQSNPSTDSFLVWSWGPCAAVLRGLRNPKDTGPAQCGGQSGLRIAQYQERTWYMPYRLLRLEDTLLGIRLVNPPSFSSVCSISCFEIPKLSQYLMWSCISLNMCDTISADCQSG